MSSEDPRYDEVDRLRELNVLLLDNLHTTVIWLAQYSERTRIRIPNLESLIRLMKESRKIMNEMVTPPLQVVELNRSSSVIRREVPQELIRRRSTVTLRNNIYIELLLKVTN